MTRPSIGRDLLDVPMGDMIRDMALAIADAQMRLDSNSVEVAQMMGGLKTITTINGAGEEVVTFSDSRVFFGKEKLSLIAAIDLYNSTTDIALKASIGQAINISSNTKIEDNVYTVSGDPNVIANTPINPSSANYYKTGTDYYDYDVTRTGNKFLINTNPIIVYRLKDGEVDSIVYIPSRVSMLELGFTPTFYQFVDTIIEVKISIRYSEETNASTSISNTSRSGSLGFRLGLGRAGINRQVNTSQVNASYSQKYSYSAEGSSLLRTKLTPIPPPAILEERIRQQMEIARETA
jgi:hypothetical protein